MISPLISDENMQPVRINEEVSCNADADEYISVSLFIQTSSLNNDLRRFMLFDSLHNAYASDWDYKSSRKYEDAVLENVVITYSRRATDPSSYYYTLFKLTHIFLFKPYSKAHIINNPDLLCQLEDHYYPEDPNVYTGLK